jgi:hypothetical protein
MTTYVNLKTSSTQIYYQDNYVFFTLTPILVSEKIRRKQLRLLSCAASAE